MIIFNLLITYSIFFGCKLILDGTSKVFFQIKQFGPVENLQNEMLGRLLFFNGAYFESWTDESNGTIN